MSSVKLTMAVISHKDIYFLLYRATKCIDNTSNIWKQKNQCTILQNKAGRKDIMTKEQLGNLIIASEDTMYHVAKTLLRNDADCADAIQEAIVKAFSGVHTLRKDSYGKTWLVRIVINECYAIMRREKRMVSLEDASFQDISFQERVVEQGDYSDLYEALSRLPEETRLIVTLYYMEGYHVKEIAVLMKTTQSAVKNRLMRARARLREELGAGLETQAMKGAGLYQ